MNIPFHDGGGRKGNLMITLVLMDKITADIVLVNHQSIITEIINESNSEIIREERHSDYFILRQVSQHNEIDYELLGTL
jgi:Fic family protein